MAWVSLEWCISAPQKILTSREEVTVGNSFTMEPKQDLGTDLLIPAHNAHETGTLLFTTLSKLIYMDSPAMSLCSRLNMIETGCAANGVLPLTITQFCGDIAEAIQVKIFAKDYTPLQIRRMTGNVEQHVLLRGYGMPHASSAEEGRILILIEDTGRLKEMLSKQAAERFHLTERELHVIMNLYKGYTNKQIAVVLEMTEQNIKEVMKRIMKKMGTSTRTGVLIKIFGL